MTGLSFAEQLSRFKIIPVLVLNDVESGLKRCEMLCRNGLGVAEITFRTEAAEAVIKAVSREFPEMCVGAGTVLNVKDLHRAFDAGRNSQWRPDSIRRSSRKRSPTDSILLRASAHHPRSNRDMNSAAASSNFSRRKRRAA